MTEPAADPPADEAAPGEDAVPEEEAGDPDDDRTIEFAGETFRIADRIGAFAMLRFQRFANTADPRAMGALYDVLQDAIHEDDWARFEDAALAGKVTDQDLIDVVGKAVECMTAEVARRNQQARAVPRDHLPPRQAVRQQRPRQGRRK